MRPIDTDLPEVAALARFLRALTRVLDVRTGWYEVFAERDPQGLADCLDGREVPPWDVVTALLHDLAVLRGPAAAQSATERAGWLYRAATAAFDARPDSGTVLRERLAAMEAEAARAQRRQRELIAAARIVRREQGDAAAARYAVDIAWAWDDWQRANARCAELRARLAARSGDAPPADLDPLAGPDSPSAPGSPSAPDPPWGPVPSPAPAPSAPSAASAPASGPAPSAGPAPGPTAPGAPAARQAREPERSRAPHVPRPRAPWRAAAHSSRTRHGSPTPPAEDPSDRPGAPAPPQGATEPAATPGPGDLRAAAPSDAALPAPPHDVGAVPPEGLRRTLAAALHPAPAGNPRTDPPGGSGTGPTGTGGSVRPPAGGPAPVPARRALAPGPADAEEAEATDADPLAERRIVAEAAARIGRLRGARRSGEAHAVLCESARWPARRLPLLAAALEREGLGADVATLLWEVGSLPPAPFAAAVDALDAAGRDRDCGLLLRQGVARPVSEVADAARALSDAARRRPAVALLAALVRARSGSEVAQVVDGEHGVLLPLLLEAARTVSAHHYQDTVHALRIAGVPGVPDIT